MTTRANKFRPNSLTMTTWSLLPVETQRKIFSYLKYWETQRKRGVNRQWLIVADSVNPDNKDSESRNVRLLCSLPGVFYYGWNKAYYWWNNWNDVCMVASYHELKEFATTTELSYHGTLKVDRITTFLKWNKKGHHCRGEIRKNPKTVGTQIVRDEGCDCCLKMCGTKALECLRSYKCCENEGCAELLWCLNGLCRNHRSGKCMHGLCKECCRTKGKLCKGHKGRR